MTEFLSPLTLTVLAKVIAGELRGGNGLSISGYKSGKSIENFMLHCGVDFSDHFPRESKLRKCLEEMNEGRDARKTLTRIIEYAADSKHFDRPRANRKYVLAYLNKHLAKDGLELRERAGKTKLVSSKLKSSAIDDVEEHVNVLNFDTVQAEVDRARDNIDRDPGIAITAACAMVESICRSILTELNVPLPKEMEVSQLYKAVCEPLGLKNLETSKIVQDDMHRILTGLASVVGGIGALRTHLGNAHGREQGYKKPEPRQARLAVSAASTISLFLLETWDKKYPKKVLNDSF